jgi:hypothetical protein
MAKLKFHVQHFIACPDIVVVRAAPDNPYTLRDVSYNYDVPADQEWPIRFDEFWLYVRFFNGRGTRHFAVDVAWLDSPSGLEEICSFEPLTVPFPGDPVHSRALRVGAVRYPGPGRYRFRLRRHGRKQVLAEEYINLRRHADDPQEA